MGCILASLFFAMLVDLGAMLGSKIEQTSIKNGIKKTIEKRRAARWPTRRSKSLRHRATGGGRAQGEGRGRGKPLPGGVTYGIYKLLLTG